VETRDPPDDLRMLCGMARVRLNAGALTAAQVRMGSRGASERLRPPGDDINSSDGPDDRLVCGSCGSTKKVDASRPRRCGPCRADEETVRDAAARLKAAGQPPLGRAPAGKTDFAKIRQKGNAAKARLAERKRNKPRPGPQCPAARPAAAASPPVPRRITASQKQAGARRLAMRIEQMEKELQALPAADKARERLREDLGVARRLLSDWRDGVH
jgi:hypothetical protein